MGLNVVFKRRLSLRTALEEKKEKKEKKEKVDLSFMGNRTKLSMNAINANKRLMKKMKK